MASEDVIELGSSDDEPEPVPKKPRKMKPTPNAMVHIPNQFRDVTIKPANQSTTNQKKILTVRKNKVHPSLSILPGNSNITIARKVQDVKILPKAPAPPIKLIGKTLPVTHINLPSYKPTINPVSLIKKLKSSHVVVNKVSKSVTRFKDPIAIQGLQTNKIVNKLPSNLQVRKITTVGKIKGIKAVDIASLNKKQSPKEPKRIPTTGVLTVDLDDDEPSTTASTNPQWYLRPEEQKEESKLEMKNNKEPKPNYIEITIEDSPVKPPNKRADEVGTELAITINDSPVRAIIENNNSGTDSDGDKQHNKKHPHSKKKLEYEKTIEIEIEPFISNTEILKDADKNDKDTVENIVEIEDSPVKKSQNKSIQKEPKAISVEKGNIDSEFHPIYQSFIDLCLKLENSEDMKKIVDKKIKSYYKQVPKEYTESEEFLELVSSKIELIQAGPEKMYLYIKDIVDELNMQRKMAKSNIPKNDDNPGEIQSSHLYGEESEYDSKRQRQIRKLEKTIKKLHKAIQKLEEQEVDFDDEEDSVFLLTERYKERMVRVHAKFCQLTNTKMPSEPYVHIEARPNRPSGPAKRIEKWINRKVPIGTPLRFPDFHDVLQCVKEANVEDKLGWTDLEVMEEARDLFTRCGKKLQRRRQENEWRLATSRLSVNLDPAEESRELMAKLEENRRTAAKKETEVFNKYVDRQIHLKLEAEEIGDKEAEESPLESEDEEPSEESSSLGNKEKRKERLRRLLQKKSRKSSVTENKMVDDRVDQDIVKVNLEETTESQIESSKLEKERDENAIEIDPLKSSKDKGKTNDEKIQSISDDSSEMGSEVGEMHLLQKLREREVDYISQSSDSESPIAISDSLNSSDDEEKISQPDNVISIENSSYSESEINEDKCDTNVKDKNIENLEVSAEIVTESDVDTNKSNESDVSMLLVNNNGDIQDRATSGSTHDKFGDENFSIAETNVDRDAELIIPDKIVSETCDETRVMDVDESSPGDNNSSTTQRDSVRNTMEVDDFMVNNDLINGITSSFHKSKSFDESFAMLVDSDEPICIDSLRDSVRNDVDKSKDKSSESSIFKNTNLKNSTNEIDTVPEEVTFKEKCVETFEDESVDAKHESEKEKSIDDALVISNNTTIESSAILKDHTFVVKNMESSDSVNSELQSVKEFTDKVDKRKSSSYAMGASDNVIAAEDKSIDFACNILAEESDTILEKDAAKEVCVKTSEEERVVSEHKFEKELSDKMDKEKEIVSALEASDILVEESDAILREDATKEMFVKTPEEESVISKQIIEIKVTDKIDKEKRIDSAFEASDVLVQESKETANKEICVKTFEEISIISKQTSEQEHTEKMGKERRIKDALEPSNNLVKEGDSILENDDSTDISYPEEESVISKFQKELTDIADTENSIGDAVVVQ